VLRADSPTAGLVELAHQGDVGTLGARLVRQYLELWEDPAVSGRMLVAAFMREAVLLPLARRIGSTQAELRAALTGAHLLGIATARYVLRIERLASADRESLVGHLAPVVQRYLTGELHSSDFPPGTDTCDGGPR